jgi:hypothetical protein
MWKTALPSASPAELPREVRLQVVSTCREIPEGDGWLHEIKHGGHRLVAVVVAGSSSRPLAGLTPMAVCLT